VIAISESTKTDLIRYCSVPSSKVSIVRHGVDDRFTALPVEETERYRRAARLPERFILYLGTVQPRKNLARLVSAFERIAKDDAHASLDDAARRELLEETGLGNVFLEQLYTFGALKRDPRERVVWGVWRRIEEARWDAAQSAHPRPPG
jgi:glycosyltransferase involved in cell wall biosynthesis